MATTDARTGFKLPWSTDRSESTSTDAASAAPPSASGEQPAAGGEPVGDGAEATAVVSHDSVAGEDPVAEEGLAVAESTHEPATRAAEPFDPWRLGTTTPAIVEPPPKRKPNKLMAELTRAMQTAAESARDETLARLQTDAKAFIETIHARSATEAEELRHTADSDIAGIREWSKAEIARIREETDQKVTERKARLDTEIEEHAARIEQRIERVQNHVAWFESEMASFFERLLNEEDPTQLAAMAESLPEPPAFDDIDDLPDPPSPAARATTIEADAVADPLVAAPAEAAETPDATPVEAEATAFEAEATPVEAEATPVEAEATQFEPEVPAVEPDGVGEPAEDPEAAFAAIQAAAEAAAAAEATVADNGSVDGPVADEAAPVADAALAGADGEDPRLTALGLSDDAPVDGEARVESDSDAAPSDAEIQAISDDTLAARLAGLVPGGGETPETDLRATRVVVTGLVSVASIASFKRYLGKLEGVASVGVSSGPDGEFVFAVSHGATVDLTQDILALPGFAAQVMSVSDDTVSVAARDPETES